MRVILLLLGGDMKSFKNTKEASDKYSENFKKALNKKNEMMKRMKASPKS